MAPIPVAEQYHADSTGSAAINTKLSEDRAKAVIAYLMQQGGVPVRYIVAPGAMGEYGRLYEHLSMAEQEAILIGDRMRLGAVCIAKVHVLSMLGNIDLAITNGIRARELAQAKTPATSVVWTMDFLINSFMIPSGSLGFGPEPAG